MAGTDKHKQEAIGAVTPQSKDERAEKPSVLFVVSNGDDTAGKAYGKVINSPETNAASTLYQFHPLRAGTNITDLVDVVKEAASEAVKGNLDRQEAMLAVQAQTLDTVFNVLAQKAAANVSAGHVAAGETFLRMALKAQSQCRTTIEALGELKYPKATNFIKQANIANQQQVNNGSSTPAPARAHEKDITPTNELLTENRIATLDAGGARSAIGLNPKLAAVGAVHRAAN